MLMSVLEAIILSLIVLGLSDHRPTPAHTRERLPPHIPHTFHTHTQHTYTHTHTKH
jgi:hypothetical protein